MRSADFRVFSKKILGGARAHIEKYMKIGVFRKFLKFFLPTELSETN